MPNGRSQVSSLALHVVAALLLFAAMRVVRAPTPPQAPIHATPLTFYRPRRSWKAPADRAGGSNHTLLPARHGSLPPRAERTFIPPSSADHPRLEVPVTVDLDVPFPSTSANMGDPLSRLGVGALGQNGDNGIGDHGCCSGIGDRKGGPPGLDVVRGRGVIPPELLYKEEPEFSEEARKAKHQGVVVLAIVVDAGGKVRDVRVRQSLGLGLDEKAADAVTHWRFRPGTLNGKPVATEAVVQVSFLLL